MTHNTLRQLLDTPVYVSRGQGRRPQAKFMRDLVIGGMRLSKEQTESYLAYREKIGYTAITIDYVQGEK